MRLLLRSVVFAVLLAVPVVSLAQATGSSSSTQKPKAATPAKPKKPPVPRLPIGVRVYGLFDAEFMTASEAFSDVTGSSMMLGYGGGADVQNVWRQIFVHGAVAAASTSGDRGFLVNGDFVPTGFTVDIGLRTVELGAGWRVTTKKHPNMAWNIGGGALFNGYKETSEFALADENVDVSKAGGYASLGLEFKIGKHLTAGVDAQYRTIPNGLGTGGISAVTDETNLGGVVVRGLFGIRFEQKKKK